MIVGGKYESHEEDFGAYIPVSLPTVKLTVCART